MLLTKLNAIERSIESSFDPGNVRLLTQKSQTKFLMSVCQFCELLLVNASNTKDASCHRKRSAGVNSQRSFKRTEELIV